MQELATPIIEELRAASSWLLEAGSAPRASARSAQSGGSGWGQLLRRIGRFGSLMPRLLEELALAGRPGRDTLVEVRTPRRAMPSRRPTDFVHLGSTRTHLEPARWLGREPEPELDPAALDWLAWLLQTLQEELHASEHRIGRHLSDLLIHTPGEGLSVYAMEQRQSLLLLERQMVEAAASLQRSRDALGRASWSTPRPQRRKPFPFPQGIAWSELSRLAREILDPMQSLTGILQQVLQDPPATADLPFLYQRWCGLRLVQVLEQLGWSARRDPIPPLFLGGRVDFAHAESQLTLWVEPRIPASDRPEAPHASGLSAHRQREASPDYVLVRDSRTGPRAWILDPSFSLGDAQARDKGRYRALLAFHDPRLVAGVPSRLPPERAWAAQPLPRTTCILHDPEGRSGTVPMLPGAHSDDALIAWLQDLASVDGGPHSSRDRATFRLA